MSVEGGLLRDDPREPHACCFAEKAAAAAIEHADRGLRADTWNAELHICSRRFTIPSAARRGPSKSD